ncbi:MULTISPECIES: hypothetical protein [Paraburkholderia]|uniref:Uncharacterized protein n=1 Tax=Paraburkholderia madseniana TaxID=2599607 RepID=A0AAP5BPL0_9BURK|nr:MULTISPECIES: hypothetical protein [Paraburkholderia]MCX4152369.1 hypothetical protein [Paraburkholderia madseniana]MCX4177813.1 hypothetical protein [Paraburkholderia madseniana]MDN7155297.1 hypothetical protein [Paraburkholderia sp. WS6]MDQ6414180.1 hypothetical protein [Paraburkholderia madseniana]MDQ6465800.1 hypothetical protein [Paraburkholderia madseniana]
MERYSQTILPGEADAQGIDLTPRWTALMPIILAALENGTNVGRGNARRSLIELADRVDGAHDMHKRMRASLDALAKAWPKADRLTEQEEDAMLEAVEVLSRTSPGDKCAFPQYGAFKLSDGLSDSLRQEVEKLLCHDEASSDGELLHVLIARLGMQANKARAIISQRGTFIMFMPTVEQPRPNW